MITPAQGCIFSRKIIFLFPPPFFENNIYACGRKNTLNFGVKIVKKNVQFFYFFRPNQNIHLSNLNSPVQRIIFQNYSSRNFCFNFVVLVKSKHIFFCSSHHNKLNIQGVPHHIRSLLTLNYDFCD